MNCRPVTTVWTSSTSIICLEWVVPIMCLQCRLLFSCAIKATRVHISIWHRTHSCINKDNKSWQIKNWMSALEICSYFVLKRCVWWRNNSLSFFCRPAMKWVALLLALAAMANSSFQLSCETSAPGIVWVSCTVVAAVTQRAVILNVLLPPQM